MKRFICALIAAVMLVCAFPLTFAAAETAYTPIELGVETAVSVSRTDVEKNFTFTAPEEGDYAFYSIGDHDTCGYLYDTADNSFIDYSDDGLDDNFFIEFYLEKGEKINLKTTLYDFTDSADYKVVVDKMTDATAIVPEADTINVYVDDEFYIDYSFSPVSSYWQYVETVPADTSIIEEDYGTLTAKKLGTTTVKLQSENGLEANVTVNVIEPRALELDKTVTVSGEEVYEFSFTPSEDGCYTVFTDFVYFGDVWVDGALTAAALEGDAYYFEKDVEYVIYVNDYSGELGLDITVKKSTPADAIEIDAFNYNGYETQYTQFYVRPLNGVITEPVTFEVSDTEIAEVELVDENIATVLLKKPGTVTVKATYGTCTDSIDYEVKAIPSVTTDTPYTVEVFGYERIMVSFTAPKDGVYRISALDSFGSEVHMHTEYDSGINRMNITAAEGESYPIILYHNDYSKGVFTVTATELTKATSVKPVYETIEAVADQDINITLNTLPENSYLEGTGEWKTSDEENSEVYGDNDGAAVFCASEVGEYTVTYTEDGLTATVKVNVKDPDELEFNAQKVQTVKDCYYNYIYTFTPDKTGVYTIEDLNDSYSNIDVFSDIIYPANTGKVYSLAEGIEYTVSYYLTDANGDISLLIREPEYATEIKAYAPYKFVTVGEFTHFEYYAVDGDDCEHLKSITVADGKIAYVFGETIVATAAGETAVEIETKSGLKASFTLVVYAKDHAYADAYDLNKYELTLDVGKSEQLSVITKPETESKVYWWSGDESVARVDANGRVTAMSEGETRITAVADGVYLLCYVKTKAPEIVDSSKTFTDVKAGKWYSKAVDYAYSYGFIAGVSKTEFGLQTPVTRGMFITILARIAGVDTSGAANKAATTKFTDVKVGKYYTAAIQWASENGIVAGITDTTFAPGASIERQQLCVMIVNFAKYMGIDITEKEDAITFTDNSKFAKYSKKAIAVCQKADIVNGYSVSGGYEFRPKNTATRGEAAQILYKFHKDFVMK